MNTSYETRCCTRAMTCLLTAMLLAPVIHADATLTFIGRLDLDDAEHTSDSGESRSEIFKVNRSGVVAGQTARYPDGAGNGLFGSSAWLADSLGRSVRIGFGGGPNVTVSQSSGIIDLNENGTAIGRSETNSGVVAWIASIARGTTRLDTFSGVENGVIDLNDGDWLIGVRNEPFSRYAYLAHADDVPVPIGLTDAAHTSVDGHRRSTPVALNNAGHVIGSSSRYADETQDLLPSTAWIRYPNGEYWLPAAAANTSQTSLLTESGYFGLYQRSPGGQTTLQVAHTSRALRTVGVGEQFDRIAENGSAVVSVLETYRGAPIKRTNWLNTASHGTVRLGLTEYLGSPSDESVDTVVALTESGVVAGHTRARLGNTAAWVADMTGTVTKIGLYGPEYEWTSGGRSGRHYTEAGGATESGLVWGNSARAFNDAENTGGGGTGWVYNVHTGALQSFVFPADERGYTNSHIDLVLENGTVVGTYMDFSSGLPDPQERVFLWIPGEGLVLLDERIDIAASAAGFDQGYGPLRHASANGMLIGFGLPTEDDSYSFRGNGIYAVRLGEDGEPPPPPPPGELGYLGRLGFYDTAHTSPDGQRWSEAAAVSATGYVAGASRRFVGAADVPAGADRPAQTAWLGDPAGATRRVGFYDALHTRDDGRWENRPVDVNDEGVSIGVATRFSGHAYAGESAWVADRHGTTLKVGYYDAAHTGSGGVKISRVVDLNNANRLVGYSLHPDTEASSAWLATSTGAVTRIGLLDAAHTAPDGTRVSLPVAINDDGYVIGVSEYHVPGVGSAGLTPWLRKPDGSVRIVGLQTGVHRAANGLHHGTVEFLSANHRVAGHAVRYGAGQSTRVGQTAWMAHVASPNRPIGFATGLHAGANQIAYSRIMQMSESGYAIGFSTQYPAGATSESAGRGRTAWIASTSAGTVRVGLYSALHSTGPFQHNDVRDLNNVGGVVGTARRYAAGADRGLDGWYATIAGGTRRLGLEDARHRRGDGYERHVPTLLTDARRIAGISARYSGNMEVGQTAWIYDVATGIYDPVQLSVRATDQFAWSVVTELREDGSAFGMYRKFGADGSHLGDRAFMYLPGVGAFDVEASLDTSPASEGWAFLGRPVEATPAGQVVGLGQLADRLTPPFSQGVYLLQE